eukprot:4950145-Amphidinium_carterae.1
MRNFKIDQYAYKKLTCEYAGASDWVNTVDLDDNVAVLYLRADCNCAPLKTNSWLKAKTCSSESHTKVQWHCPHCCSKWKWGKSAPLRGLYQGQQGWLLSNLPWHTTGSSTLDNTS